jgi:hypothetical protein
MQLYLHYLTYHNDTNQLVAQTALHLQDFTCVVTKKKLQWIHLADVEVFCF